MDHRIVVAALLCLLAGSARAGHSESYAAVTASPANPTGTTNTTGLMMGLGASCVITPRQTGRIEFRINGDVTNGTSADAAKLQLREGTGSAPANAAAASGTALGGFVQATTSTNKLPFMLHGLATGLAVNTAVWFDIQLAAVTGGTASILDLTCIAREF